MTVFSTLWRKELSGYLLQPMAYVTTVFFLAVTGFSFWVLALVLAEGSAGVNVLQALFESLFFWIALMVIVPVLTMRLYAEEKRSGTVELLMTAPVSDVSVVLSKYAAALTMYALMWLPTGAYLVILNSLSPMTVDIDLGAVLSGYLGAMLVGSFFVALGLLASCLTSSQVVAAMASFALFGLFFFSGLLGSITHNEVLRETIEYISAYEHMADFARGIIDSRPVVLYITLTVFCLFVSVKVVEARKWK